MSNAPFQVGDLVRRKAGRKPMRVVGVRLHADGTWQISAIYLKALGYYYKTDIENSIFNRNDWQDARRYVSFSDIIL